MEALSFFKQTDLFISGFAGGIDGYNTCRIPSLIVTTKGSILAFCEGRKNDGDDAGDIDMVMKRSVDGGKTWSKTQVIWNDGGNTCGNPCPVVDKENGRISLFMTHNLGFDNENLICDGKSKGTRTVWVTNSVDDGVTWTHPAEITKTVKKEDWTWYATGPGAGIQLKNGRLVIPCDHIESGSKGFYSHIIYSDNHGKTWQLGGSTSSNKVNECEVVALEDDKLLLNMRNHDVTHKTRAISISNDGGLTWSPITHDQTLIEPRCQASIRRFTSRNNGNRSRILFSNPANTDERENMTVRLTYDECKTWPIAKQLYNGPSAYSCLAVLADMSIACLYECGVKNAYEKIVFANFSLKWLTDGTD